VGGQRQLRSQVRRAARLGGSVTAVALLLSGCATPTLDDVAAPAADAGTDDLDAAPGPEDTDGDAPVPGPDVVRVELPGVPSGGTSEYVEDGLQCALVNWSGPPDLIDGVRFTVTDVSFTPDGVYALSAHRCAEAPPCLPDWLGSDPCTVAVAWTGQPSVGDGELQFTGGVLTCAAEMAETCRAFGAEVSATELRGPDLLPFPDPAGGGGAQDGGGDGGDGGGDGGDGGGGDGGDGGGDGDDGGGGGDGAEDDAGATGEVDG
jgi:hypothetical protein